MYFLDELVNVDKSNPPAWINQSLFNTLRPIVSFANFRDGVVGESSLAGVLGLPISMVSTPLNRILFPLFPTSPDPKEVIAKAVQEHLVGAIEAYSSTITSLIPLFSTFGDTYAVLAEEQAAVVPRMRADAPGTPPATAEQCIAAWNGVRDAATNIIDLLSGGGATKSGATESFRAAATDAAPVSPGDVTAAFGPPSKATETLPEMSATTGQIVANFNKILTLPFVE